MLLLNYRSRNRSQKSEIISLSFLIFYCQSHNRSGALPPAKTFTIFPCVCVLVWWIKSGSNRAQGDFTLKQPVYKSFTELQEGKRLRGVSQRKPSFHKYTNRAKGGCRKLLPPSEMWFLKGQNILSPLVNVEMLHEQNILVHFILKGQYFKDDLMVIRE